MPNGGSDCCGTCWFNEKNQGQAGYAHASDTGRDFCIIRSVRIDNAFWTYCGNHPHRRPEQDPIPIGPIFVPDEDSGGASDRKIWQPSPDSEEIRLYLLDLVSRIVEQPAAEYPIGAYTDELVVWQLGEFREQRAALELQRLAAFSSTQSSAFGRTRASLVAAAGNALSKIDQVR